MNNFQMSITDMQSATTDRPCIFENTCRPFPLPTIQPRAILIIVYTEGNLWRGTRVDMDRVVSTIISMS